MQLIYRGQNLNYKPAQLVLLALSLSLLSPKAAKAANFVIDATSPDEMITISLNDFERGFYVNGSLIQQGTNSPASVTVSEANPVSFLGRWIDRGQSIPLSRTIYLIERSNPRQISHIFDYTVSTKYFYGTIQGTFVSDFNNDLGNLPANVDQSNIFVENNKPVLFNAAFLTGEIRSDVESVPEGSNALGLILLAGTLGLNRLVARQSQQ